MTPVFTGRLFTGRVHGPMNTGSVYRPLRFTLRFRKGRDTRADTTALHVGRQ